MRTPSLILLVALAFGSGSASAQGFDIAWNVCGGGPVEKVLDCSDVAGPDVIVVTFRPAVPFANFVGLEADLCITNLDGPLPDFWQVGPGGCNDGFLNLSGTGAGVTCPSPWGGPSGFSGSMAYETPDAGNPNRARVHVWAHSVWTGNPGCGDGYFGFRLQIFHDNASICGGCDAPVIITLNSVTLRSHSCPSGSVGTEHVVGVIRSHLIAVNHGVLAPTSAPLTLGLVRARVNPVAGRDLVSRLLAPRRLAGVDRATRHQRAAGRATKWGRSGRDFTSFA